MVFDGGQLIRKISAALRQQVRDNNHGLHVVFVTLNHSQATQTYVAEITKSAGAIGIGIGIEQIPSGEQKTGGVLHQLLRFTKDYDAICLELPLPLAVDTDSVRRLFPMSHDVMVFGDVAYTQFREQRLPYLPPVADAFLNVAKHLSLHVAGLRVTVLGRGRTVGVPMAQWLQQVGAEVTVVDTGEDVEQAVHDAQVVISGLGTPNVIQPGMLTGTPVLVDVGVHEIGGVGTGDIDPACAEHASAFVSATDVMQPLCRLMTLQNVFAVAELQKRQHVIPVRVGR